MDRDKLEEYVVRLFGSMGYKASVTQSSRDFGVDMIAKRTGEKIAIQVKRYKQSVGVSAVQQVVAGMHKYSCNKSMVVTNNYFTSAAKELASHSCCKLVDRDGLAVLIRSVQAKISNSSESPNPAGVTEGDNGRTERILVTCSNCRQQLRLPAGKSGKVDCPSCQNAFFVST